MFETPTAAAIAGAFVFGLLVSLLGNLRATLAKHLLLGEERIGGLLTALSIVLIPMMIVSGVLVDSIGTKTVLLAGSAAMAVGIGLLAVSTTYLHSLGSILLSGAGGACVSSSSILLMTRAFFPENTAASQNLGNVFFCVGVLVTPALVKTMLEALGFRRGMLLIAMICLAPAACAAITHAEAFTPLTERTQFGDVLNTPMIWLCGLVFLLYIPIENSLGLGNLSTSYLAELGVSEKRRSWGPIGFWLTFLGGRLAMAWMQHEHWLKPLKSEVWVILFLAVLTAVFLGNMVGARGKGSGVLALLLVGAFLGPIFPNLTAYVLEKSPQDPGLAFGTMFSIGMLGALPLQSLMASLARRGSWQRTMVMPMILAILLALVAFVLGVM